MDILEIRGHCMRYAWGMTKESQPLVATLLAAEEESQKSQQNSSTTTTTTTSEEHFAELWFGTHESGPTLARAEQNGADWKPLSSILERRLKFLFKILSVSTTLSIQAHPDSILAEKLHLLKPKTYKDPFHKPEVCLALTEFEALCSFKPQEDQLLILSELPELSNLIKFNSSAFSIQTMFKNLMHSSTCDINSCIKMIFSKYNQQRGGGEEQNYSKTTSDAIELAVRLNKQFPNDVGVLCAFFMNHMILEPGQALFIGPGEPHAYIRGECAECMACSDNVIRAGLTPKEIDKETLLSMLTYKQGRPNLLEPTRNQIGNKDSQQSFICVYNPPVDDFIVADWVIFNSNSSKNEQKQQQEEDLELPFENKDRIMLVLEGNGKIDGKVVSKGSAVYVNPTNTKSKISAISNRLRVLIAMSNPSQS